MVVQAIALLDDLDKEINIYAMRLKVRFINKHKGLVLGRLNRILLSRNGMAGISPRWLKLSLIALPTQKSFE